ncbi:hypothetical protein GH733_003690, partial [Mirounga leonina]
MDEMHTPYSSLKRLLSFFNGFVMSGVIPIGLSIYVKFRGAVLIRVLGLASAYLLHIGYLCLAVGCITVLLSFAGWYGATKESRGTLLFCFLSAVIILIAEIIVTAVVLALFHIVKNYTDFSGYCYPRSGCKSIGTAACNGRDVSTDIIHQGVTRDCVGGHLPARNSCHFAAIHQRRQTELGGGQDIWSTWLLVILSHYFSVALTAFGREI